MSAFSWDTDGCATVGNTVCELVDAAGLVSTSKTHGVVLSVNCNVLLVTAFELLDSCLDVLHTSFLSHFLRREVAVKTSSIPVTWNRLGVERDFGTKFFGNTVEEETSKPKVVTQLNTVTRTHLELPLSWHNLGVSTRDLHTGEQAGLVVSLDNISAVDLASTNTTVVRALGSWETVDWPSIGPVCQVKEGILLLETEPWLVGLVGLHELGTLVAVVELVWSSIWVPALGDNQDVGSTTEWVGEDSNRPEVDIRIVAWGLASRAAVKVPLWKVLNLEDTVLGDFGESL